jgi:hypothetical protein
MEALRRREREMDTEKQRLEERLLHLLQYEQGKYLRVMINILTDLVQHFAYRGSSHRREGAARLKNLYGLAISLAYPSDEGGKFTRLIISTCLRGAWRMRGRSAPCSRSEQ